MYRQEWGNYMYKVDLLDNESNMLITKTDIYTNLPVSFWLKDILYFEVEKRKIIAHKADGTTIQYKGSLRNVKEEYAEYNFIQCFKSVLVQLKYVKELKTKEKKNDLILEGGMKIPLSRTYKKDFLQAYKEYGLNLNSTYYV